MSQRAPATCTSPSGLSLIQELAKGISLGVNVEREWTFFDHVKVPVGVIKQFPSQYCMQVHMYVHAHPPLPAHAYIYADAHISMLSKFL